MMTTVTMTYDDDDDHDGDDEVSNNNRKSRIFNIETNAYECRECTYVVTRDGHRPNCTTTLDGLLAPELSAEFEVVGDATTATGYRWRAKRTRRPALSADKCIL